MSDQDAYTGAIRNPRIKDEIKSMRLSAKGLLDGGTETEYFGDICAGDTLRVVNRLENLEVRESKALGKMLITTQRTTFTNQHGKVVAVQTGQAIYY